MTSRDNNTYSLETFRKETEAEYFERHNTGTPKMVRFSEVIQTIPVDLLEPDMRKYRWYKVSQSSANSWFGGFLWPLSLFFDVHPLIL